MLWARGPLLALAVASVLVVGAAAVFPYIAPFILAALLAVLVDPVVAWTTRRLRWGRGSAVLLVAAVCVTGCSAVLLLVTVQLARELAELARHAPELTYRAHGWIAHVLETLEGWSAHVPPPLRDAVRRMGLSVVDVVAAQVHGVLRSLGHLPEFLFVGSIATFTAYFFLRDKHVLARTLLAPLPPVAQRGIREIVRRLSAGAVGFLRAQLVLMTLTGACAVAVFRWCGVPYPWVLGSLAGLLDAVPLLGPGGVFVPLIVVQLAVGETALALKLLGSWGAILGVRQLIEPRMLGTQMGLHPVTAMMALYVAVRAIGLAGFVFGPLAAVFLKAAFSSFPPRCQGKAAWYNTSRKGRNKRCSKPSSSWDRQVPSADRPWTW